MTVAFRKRIPRLHIEFYLSVICSSVFLIIPGLEYSDNDNDSGSSWLFLFRDNTNTFLTTKTLFGSGYERERERRFLLRVFSIPFSFHFLFGDREGRHACTNRELSLFANVVKIHEVHLHFPLPFTPSLSLALSLSAYSSHNFLSISLECRILRNQWLFTNSVCPSVSLPLILSLSSFRYVTHLYRTESTDSPLTHLLGRPVGAREKWARLTYISM